MTAGMKKDRADFLTSVSYTHLTLATTPHPFSYAVLHDFFRQAMMAGLRPTLAAAKAFATVGVR